MTVPIPAEERRLAKLAGRLQDDTAERDELIRLLRDRGYTLRRLAELAGLSHPGIAKIVNREDER